MSNSSLILFVLTLSWAGCTMQTNLTETVRKDDVPEHLTSTNQAIIFIDLANYLSASGAEVKTGDEIEQPFFSATGQKLLVNGEDVQVFEYASEEARKAESDQISKDGYTIGTTTISWIGTPHFWAKGKIISLYVGEKQEIIALLDKAMGPAITEP